jgi:hypothetical protein
MFRGWLDQRVDGRLEHLEALTTCTYGMTFMMCRFGARLFEKQQQCPNPLYLPKVWLHGRMKKMKDLSRSAIPFPGWKKYEQV